jgi:hypothetical protein
MRTWVHWTHFDCEVNISLHPTEEDAYQELRRTWMDECDEDCGHNTDDPSWSQICEAVEYHYEELSWGIYEVAVPVQDITVSAPVSEPPPTPVSITSDQAGDLLGRLSDFQGS